MLQNQIFTYGNAFFEMKSITYYFSMWLIKSANTNNNNLLVFILNIAYHNSGLLNQLKTSSFRTLITIKLSFLQPSAKYL